MSRAIGQYEDTRTGPNHVLRPVNVMRTSPNQVLRPIKNFYYQDPYFSPVKNKRNVAPTMFVLTIFLELPAAL